MVFLWFLLATCYHPNPGSVHRRIANLSDGGTAQGLLIEELEDLPKKSSRDVAIRGWQHDC